MGDGVGRTLTGRECDESQPFEGEANHSERRGCFWDALSRAIQLPSVSPASGCGVRIWRVKGQSVRIEQVHIARSVGGKCGVRVKDSQESRSAFLLFFIRKFLSN